MTQSLADSWASSAPPSKRWRNDRGLRASSDAVTSAMRVTAANGAGRSSLAPRPEMASPRRHSNRNAAARGIDHPAVPIRTSAVLVIASAARGVHEWSGVFVGVLFWSWVWGVLLAVPMMMVIKVIYDHVEPLQSVGHLP